MNQWLKELITWHADLLWGHRSKIIELLMSQGCVCTKPLSKHFSMLTWRFFKDNFLGDISNGAVNRVYRDHEEFLAQDIDCIVSRFKFPRTVLMELCVELQEHMKRDTARSHVLPVPTWPHWTSWTRAHFIESGPTDGGFCKEHNLPCLVLIPEGSVPKVYFLCLFLPFRLMDCLYCLIIWRGESHPVSTNGPLYLRVWYGWRLVLTSVLNSTLIGMCKQICLDSGTLTLSIIRIFCAYIFSLTRISTGSYLLNTYILCWTFKSIKHGNRQRKMPKNTQYKCYTMHFIERNKN